MSRGDRTTCRDLQALQNNILFYTACVGGGGAHLAESMHALSTIGLHDVQNLTH